MSHPIYFTFARAIRPAFRFPFPKRWKLFARVLNNDHLNERWQGKPVRWTRSKTNSYLIPCDLSVFSGRIAWYFRRWYENETESVIQSLLAPGDTFVDVGGNVGMASLAARRSIGASGSIVAFEPNPRIAAIYQQSMRHNGIENYTLVEAALGPVAGTSEFFVPDENHGEAHIGSDSHSRPGEGPAG